MFILGGVLGLTRLVAAGPLPAQSVRPEVQAHVDAARASAGDLHPRLFHYLCEVPEPPRGGAAPPAPAGLPEWYAEPARIFDNLYFLGTRTLNAYAVTTSAGIVVIDPMHDENVELAVVVGLERLGLDPRDITHVIVSHGHGDHYGGAARLQRDFGARVFLSAADWDLIRERQGSEPLPHRDGVIGDGQVLEVGDTRFHFTLTPGHTPGTVSTVFEVRDGGEPHVAAIWGGTAMDESLAAYQAHAGSARKFAAVVREAGADVVLANHDIFDEAHRKIQTLAERPAGGRHPFVVGREGVLRYLEVVRGCAAAGIARLPLATQ
jgi:metallo-beta-lactamase class B